MPEHVIWTGLQFQMGYLQAVLRNIGGGERKAEDVIAPLYQVVRPPEENDGSWVITPAKDEKGAFYSPKLRDEIIRVDPILSRA